MPSPGFEADHNHARAQSPPAPDARYAAFHDHRAQLDLRLLLSRRFNHRGAEVISL